MKLKYTNLAVCAGLAISLNQAFAETAVETVSNTPEVVDLGTSTVTAEIDLNSLYAEELLSRPSSSLGVALSNNMGVNADTFGAAATRPIVRGQRGERVTVLSSGSPQLDASNASPDHAITIDSLTSDKIEILRGVKALAHGSNVTTGVINVENSGILLDKPNQNTGAKLGVKGASVDDSKVFYADGHLLLADKVALTFAASTQDKKDYEVPKRIALEEHDDEHMEVHEGEDDHDHDHDHEDELDHNELQNGKKIIGTFSDEDFARVGLSFLADAFQAGVGFEDFEKSYGLPGHAHNDCRPEEGELNCEAHEDEHEDDHDEAHESEHEHGTPPFIKLKAQSTQVKARYLPDHAAVKTIELNAKYTDYEHYEYDEGVKQTTISNQGLTANLDLASKPLASSKLGISAGLGYKDYDFAAIGSESYVPKTNTTSFSAYTTQNYRVSDSWQIDGGLRLQRQEIKRFDDGETVSLSGMSAALDNHYALTEDADLSIGLSYSQRLPNATELFADGAHLATNTCELGNSKLDAETTKGVELGFKKNMGKTRFDVNLYHNWIDDYIYGKTLDYDEGVRLIKYNQDDATIYGADAELSYAASPTLTLVGFGDIVRGVFKDAEDGGSKYLPRMPAPRVGAKAIVYATSDITAEVSAYHRFKQDKLAAFETVTPSYNMVDASMRYDHYAASNSSISEYSLYLSVNNLLNEMAYNHASYLADRLPQPGRSVLAGIELRH